ncbi:hypothetical protein GBJ27_09200, partial [Bifidobacterium longum]
FVSVASGHLTLLAVGQVLQRSLEPAPPCFFLGGGGTAHRGNMYMCMLLQCTFCCQLTTS